jgi:hypothetical protein
VTAPHDRRLIIWSERGALLLLVVYLFIHTMPRAWMRLNTDFPNYYLSARLARESVDTSREYEWIWLQREKDHRGIEAGVIGLVPITPFSTLVMWPLAILPALTAKHLWILANLAFLVPLCWLLRSMTGLAYRRIAIIFAFSFPLHRNLLYGQFYILLLLLIVTACWATLRERNATAGALLAIAAMFKVFPVLLFVLFLRRRNWTALLSGVISGIAALVISVAVFGWNLHRTYLHQVLPWTLRGETLPPYNIASASISSVLHALFLQEPQWNPHPWHSSPLFYALLQPMLQMLILAPAILLIRRDDRNAQRILLEWSALLTGSLTISTSPASYHFVLMVLPVCVLASILLERRRYVWLILLTVAYLGIGFPISTPAHAAGLAILLYTPRLFLMLAVLAGLYALLWPESISVQSNRDRTQYAWAAGMIAIAVLGIRTTLQQERAVRQEFAYRIPSPALLNASPQRAGPDVAYISMTPTGYRLTPPRGDALRDELSFTAGDGHIVFEEAAVPHSSIVDDKIPRAILVDGREPMLSTDGRRDIAFLRDHRGRGQLMLRRSFLAGGSADIALTPSRLNVYEASFRSASQYAFSAVEGSHPPTIYLTDGSIAAIPLGLGESRYPALSPDGNWMAYSRLDGGAWNLWLRDEQTGATRRVADVPCNQIQPSWEPDSKTLLYAVDCGRGLWLTALARRRVLP